MAEALAGPEGQATPDAAAAMTATDMMQLGVEPVGEQGSKEAEAEPEGGAVGDTSEGGDNEERIDFGVHGKLTLKEAEQKMWMQPHFTKQMQSVSAKEAALAQKEAELKALEQRIQSHPASGQQQQPDFQAALQALEGDPTHGVMSQMYSQMTLLQQQLQAGMTDLSALKEAKQAIIEDAFEVQFEQATREGGKYHDMVIDKEIAKKLILGDPETKFSRNMVEHGLQRIAGRQHVEKVAAGKVKSLPTGTGANAGKKLTPKEIEARKHDETDRRFGLGKYAKRLAGAVGF